MAMFELTLRGFDGASDLTDDRILWVEADMTTEELKARLAAEGLYAADGVVTDVAELEISDDADFTLPEQLFELEVRARKLVWGYENPTDAAIVKLFEAADNHGVDSGEPDHTVGDLQDLLRKAWGIMSVSQKLALLESDEAKAVFEAGDSDWDGSENLVAEAIRRELREKEELVRSAGYAFLEGEDGFRWDHEEKDEAGQWFPAREDAVESAYRDNLAGQI